MTNPDKRTSYLRKLVSAARSVVTYQTGLPCGCTHVHRALLWLQPFDPPHFPVFREYLDATRELPIGTERLYWNRDALRDLDVQLEAINREFRDRVFQACYEIIDRYAVLPDDPTTTAQPTAAASPAVGRQKVDGQ